MDMLFVVEVIAVTLVAFFLIFKGTCENVVTPLAKLAENICDLISVFVLLYSVFLRSTHQGKVCAGVYLNSGDLHEGYMTTFGTFYLITGYLLMLLLILSCCD